jgi:hypothetical protein
VSMESCSPISARITSSISASRDSRGCWNRWIWCLNLVGGYVHRRSWPLLRPGGVLVSVVGGTDLARPPGGVQVVFFVVETDRRLLVEIAAGSTTTKAAGGLAGKVALKVKADRSWVQPAGRVAR